MNEDRIRDRIRNGKLWGMLRSVKAFCRSVAALPSISSELTVLKNARSGIQAELEDLEKTKLAFQAELEDLEKTKSVFQTEMEDLKNAKQFLADTAAHHAYLLRQFDRELKEEKSDALRLSYKMKYLLEGNAESAPKVVQVVVPALWYGDAIGNYALGICRVLADAGISCEVYAGKVDERIQEPDIGIHTLDHLPVLNKKDILILHVATEDRMLDMLEAFFCKIVICYHNITPASFFEKYNPGIADSARRGREQLRNALQYADCCLADSDYNRDELRSMGFGGRIEVLPPLPDYRGHGALPGKSRENVEKKREKSGQGTVLLSVGRVVPNKKLEDVLKAFQRYRLSYDEQARLILVGKYEAADPYYQELDGFIRENGIENVTFTGHISSEERNAYFASADAYLCMSEHEGFCVPLVEAMHFDLPIVAFNSTAAPYTLGGAGVLLDKKDPETVAAAVNRLQTDRGYREQVIGGQRRRLAYFESDEIRKKLCSFISEVMEET